MTYISEYMSSHTGLINFGLISKPFGTQNKDLGSFQNNLAFQREKKVCFIVFYSLLWLGGKRETFTGRREKESRLLESKNTPKVRAFLKKTTRARPRRFRQVKPARSNEIPDQAMDY